MKWNDLKFIISQCSSSTSLLRAFQNLDFKNRVKISHNTIDLGAKDGRYKYHDLIQKAPDTKITFSDLHPMGPGILKIDFNEDFPIDSNLFNNILVFNVLEHVWDTRNILAESKRILAPGGTIFGSVPFLFRFHSDPSDFWRFTHESMMRLLEEAGFSEIEVIPHGVGCFSVSVNTFSNLLKFRIIISIVWLIALSLDQMLNKIWPQNQTYYLGLYFKATKPLEMEAEAGIEPA
jgi:SAM-dependent methyltransferase